MFLPLDAYAGSVLSVDILSACRVCLLQFFLWTLLLAVLQKIILIYLMM